MAAVGRAVIFIHIHPCHRSSGIRSYSAVIFSGHIQAVLAALGAWGLLFAPRLAV